VTSLAVSATIGTTGCSSGNNIQDSDGDGVIDSEDYAANDPNVQEKSDVDTTETPEPAPEPYEVFNQPACTDDDTFKMVGAEFDRGTQLTTIESVVIENVGNERAYEISVLPSLEGLKSTSGCDLPGGTCGRTRIDGDVEAGTRFTAYTDTILEAAPEDISIYILAEFDTRYGDLHKVCV
jgi:hypothetical protein